MAFVDEKGLQVALQSGVHGGRGRGARCYVERVETEELLRIRMRIGSRFPFCCTASGMTSLASRDRRHRATILDTASLEQPGPGTITDSVALAGS